MKDCLYVFYNKLSNRYESVISQPTDAVLINVIQHSGKFDKEKYDVCKIGVIDITSGVVNSFSPVRLEIPSFEENPLPVEENK